MTPLMLTQLIHIKKRATVLVLLAVAVFAVHLSTVRLSVSFGLCTFIFSLYPVFSVTRDIGRGYSLFESNLNVSRSFLKREKYIFFLLSDACIYALFMVMALAMGVIKGGTFNYEIFLILLFFFSASVICSCCAISLIEGSSRKHLFLKISLVILIICGVYLSILFSVTSETALLLIFTCFPVISVIIYILSAKKTSRKHKS